MEEDRDKNIHGSYGYVPILFHVVKFNERAGSIAIDSRYNPFRINIEDALGEHR